ncbi:PqqD family protein [Pseudomonadota bacterium]
MKVGLSDKVEISSEVLCQEVGGEMVLLDLNSEAYFGLDPVGARIWSLLQTTGDLSKVYEKILSEYKVEPVELESDLLIHIGQLMHAGLLILESPNQ